MRETVRAAIKSSRAIEVEALFPHVKRETDGRRETKTDNGRRGRRPSRWQTPSAIRIMAKSEPLSSVIGLGERKEGVVLVATSG